MIREIRPCPVHRPDKTELFTVLCSQSIARKYSSRRESELGFECAGSDDGTGEYSERIERGDDGIDVRQSPCRADRAHEEGKGRKHECGKVVVGAGAEKASASSHFKMSYSLLGMSHAGTAGFTSAAGLHADVSTPIGLAMFLSSFSSDIVIPSFTGRAAIGFAALLDQ